MTKNNSKVELVRVGMNLPVQIVNQVKEYADSLGLTVTSAYIVLLNQALQQKDMVDNLPLMVTVLNELKKLEGNTDKNDSNSTLEN